MSNQVLSAYLNADGTTSGISAANPLPVGTVPLSPTTPWSYAAAVGGLTNVTTAVTMKAAAGAGLRNYITNIQISAGALGAATEVAVRDGASGTVLFRIAIPTTGGQLYVDLTTPIRSTANTLLEVVTLTATITGGVYINAQGFVAP